MKIKLKNTAAAGFLLLAITCFSLGISAQRQRVATEPTPPPTVTPTPIVTPMPTPTPVPVQTLPFLQAKIRSVLQRPELRRGHIGVKIVSLDTGRTVFDENSEKYFMPASNMKVFTVAAALEKLSPNFKFVTSVFAPGKPDENGLVKGDLTIYGRGDISFSTAFADGDYYQGLDNLAERIAASGVKRIEGDLIGDESYFRGNAIPESWEWEDLQWYYGAGISALSLNDNAVDLQVSAGSGGGPCLAQIKPANTVFRIINTCTTGGSKSTLQVVKRLDQNIIEISGTLPAGDKGFRGYISVSRPAELFIALLRQRLEQKGIVITGTNRIVSSAKDPAAGANRLEIARIESPPLSIIAQKTLKPSQNLYTETILRSLGEQVGDAANREATSAEKGLAVVRKFLQETGAAPDSVIQWDGSGLSRHNLVTPEAVVRVYTYMAKSRYALVWNASLTVGGIDGTLRNRFKGTSAAANVRGKTGTIDQVSSLSGYVNSAAGERFVFSIIVNGVNQTSLRVSSIDEIVVALADYNGRSD